MNTPNATLFDKPTEASVLGAIMIEPVLMITAVRYLKDPIIFYFAVHQQVYRAILDLHAEGIQPELVDVAQRLRRNGSQVTAVELIELTRHGTPYNLEVRCMQLYELYFRRDNQTAGVAFVRDIEDLTIDALQAVHRFNQHTDQTAVNLPDRRVKSLADISRAVLEEMGQQGSHLIRSGIRLFDEAIGGYEPGCMYVPAARPSMGKSAFLCQQVNGIAINQQIPTGLLLLEGTDKAIVRRLCTRYCGYSVEDIRLGKVDPTKVAQALAIVEQAPLQIDDSPCSLDRLESRITRMVLNGAQIIFVDYLQRVRDHRPRANAMETTTAISATLKDLAKTLNVPVVALSQLSREPDKRSSWDKRPVMSDLRGSGDLEQDADAIFFLFRPEYYHLDTYPDGLPTENLTEVHIAKSRDGAIRTGDDAVVLLHRLKYSAYYSSKGEFDNAEPGLILAGCEGF